MKLIGDVFLQIDKVKVYFLITLYALLFLIKDIKGVLHKLGKRGEGRENLICYLLHKILCEE
jgi:hypothetical protein